MPLLSKARRKPISGIMIDVMRTQLCGVLVAFGLLATPSSANVPGTAMNAGGTPIAGMLVTMTAYETFKARRVRLLLFRRPLRGLNPRTRLTQH